MKSTRILRPKKCDTYDTKCLIDFQVGEGFFVDSNIPYAVSKHKDM